MWQAFLEISGFLHWSWKSLVPEIDARRQYIYGQSHIWGCKLSFSICAVFIAVSVGRSHAELPDVCWRPIRAWRGPHPAPEGTHQRSSGCLLLHSKPSTHTDTHIPWAFTAATQLWRCLSCSAPVWPACRSWICREASVWTRITSSKHGWTSSSLLCCRPSPETSSHASATETSAAAPTRLCTKAFKKTRSWFPCACVCCIYDCLYLFCCVYSVKELSQHFSGLDPVRQKWIYSFFMYPFLSRNTSSGNASPLALDMFVFCEGFVQVWVVWFYVVVVVGCINPEDSTEDWLMKNFGSFSVMAQVRDFTSINMIFSGVGTLTLASDVILMVIRWHPQLCADVLRFFPVLSAGGFAPLESRTESRASPSSGGGGLDRRLPRPGVSEFAFLSDALWESMAFKQWHSILYEHRSIRLTSRPSRTGKNNTSHGCRSGLGNSEPRDPLYLQSFAPTLIKNNFRITRKLQTGYFHQGWSWTLQESGS